VLLRPELQVGVCLPPPISSCWGRAPRLMRCWLAWLITEDHIGLVEVPAVIGWRQPSA
jgi:hypothetical protein